jgi:hypothetical protein
MPHPTPPALPPHGARPLTGARLSLLASGLCAVVAFASHGFDEPAQAQIAVQNQGYVPYSDAPINYRSNDLSDPVALLQKKLDQGRVKLSYDNQRGYLASVLKALNIPASSQTLVFSKTSFQFTKISPDHPRALYYNDDVYVGSVHQGKTIEIVSFDPMQGAIFYLLDDVKTAKPVFQRAELDCTQCHIAPATRGVPGVLLRSVYPSQTGNLVPRATQYITDQKSPFDQRWGGWYVTGALAPATMANAAVVRQAEGIAVSGEQAPPRLGSIETPFDASAYIVPTSDQVALLVLAHQTQMHNLVTLVNYQTRIGLHALGQTGVGGRPAALESLPADTQDKIRRPSEQLLQYLLFSNETPLGGQDARKAVAASAFAREFAVAGARDSKGRSLRDFDLGNRIFRYPCSYLIYSSAFDAIPEPAKGYIYHRLFQVLTGEDRSENFAHLTAQDRQAILSILLETKAGLPEEWRVYARSNGLRVAASAKDPRPRSKT